MKIGILGAGKVGGALGEAWARQGHEIVFGVRNLDAPSLQAILKRCGGKASARTPAHAVRAADVVLVALPWPATKPVLESLDLRGKVLMDCTNPFRPDLSGLEVGTTTSGGEMVAEWAAGSRVVKIFNTTGFGNMVNPLYDGKPIPIFYCGDDASAKNIAAGLAGDLGLDPIDAGPLANARLLEPHALLWVWLAVKGGMGRNFAFQIVKR
jgi:8-hydroxy-5-deazaflavin:NADPH oxidoreductase